MTTPFALIVDDEPDICELIELTLSRMNIVVKSAKTLAEAFRLLEQQTFDLCLTDMKLPDGDGLTLVEHIQERHPMVPIAVITAYGSMESAIRALKSGAFDFVSKPLDLSVLRKLVGKALQLQEPIKSDRRSRQVLLGDSAPMREIRSKILKLARSQAPIFISGESGSGKELVARLIHDKGPRAQQPFVAVNCGAIPVDLMESEFFGHRKGSFTGAVGDKVGLFQAADGGTLFLDEVADLPLSLQVKLLRAIQAKQIRPVGESREINIDVRILSASHRNLAQMVKDGEFRQDLFYRINVIELHVPPLRERIQDVRTLTEHILERIAGGSRLPTPVLSDDARQALERYSFPGNVRELENILERATALSENNVIREADLNLPLDDTKTTSVAFASSVDSAELPLESFMDQVERDAIMKALESTRWNKTKAAQQLGITFRALRYRLKKLGLE